MSIDLKIQELLHARKLCLYSPAYPDPDFHMGRELYMTDDVRSRCPASGRSCDNTITPQMLAEARALFDKFVGGEELEEDVHLKILDPKLHGIVELRITQPHRQQNRIVGFFPRKNLMIAVRARLRGTLGDRGDGGWTNAIGATSTFKASHLGDECIKSVRIDDYISNGVSAWK